MNQVRNNLEEKTNIIKSLLKSWTNNILSIGKELSEIKEQKLYKDKYKNFNEYTLDAFGFTDASAYRYVDVYRKYGQNVSRWDKMKDYGMRVLLMSIHVPDEHFDEMLDIIEKSPLKGHTNLAKEVKRFSKQVGSQPRYTKDDSEHILKAKREAQSLIEKFEDFKELKLNLQISIEKWILSYEHYQLNQLKEDLNIILLELK